MRLYRSNLRRLVRRPATVVTILLQVSLLLLIMLAIVAASRQAVDPQSALASRLILSFPGAWTLTLTMAVAIGGLLGLMYGAAIAGSEWAWGTLKAAVARGESRAWYALMAIAGAVTLAWTAVLLAYAAGIAGALVGGSAVGITHDTLIDADTAGSLVGQIARAGLGIAMDVAIGFAIASVARSQLAGIGAGIALYIGEGIIGVFVPSIVKWAPFAAMSAMLGGGEGALASAGSASRLDPTTATLVCVGWLLLAGAGAALWTERAEIGG